MDPLTIILSRDIIVEGKVKRIKLDGGLSKPARFMVGGDSKKHFSEIGIDAYHALPCYCPFLKYKLTVKMEPQGGLFKVKRVNQCSKLFPTGIPKKKLLSAIDKSMRVKLTLPPVIKSLDDLCGIENSNIRNTLIDLCKPCFKPKLFYQLLPYFPYSVLRHLDETQLSKLDSILRSKPHLFCFRSAYQQILNDLAPKESNKLIHTISDVNNDITFHAKDIWRYYTTGDDDKVYYKPTSPMWSVSMLKYYCQDHGIEKPVSYFATVADALFIYTRCEYERATHAKVYFDVINMKVRPDLKVFFVENKILADDINPRLLMLPKDQVKANKLRELLSKAKEKKLATIDMDTTLDECYDMMLSKGWLKDAHVICPHVSNTLYLQAKMEKGTNFEREKPKRGRKRKVQDADTAETEVQKNTNMNIYYWEQWHKIKHNNLPTKRMIIFNAQELSLSQWVDCLDFEYPEKFELVIIGISKMWCPSIQYIFNSIVKVSGGPVLSGIKANAMFNIEEVFLNKSMSKKHDTYQNEEKLSEFLNDLMTKDKSLKWKSKLFLFTNERLMDTVSTLTNEKQFKIGPKTALYLESAVKVDKLGLYGIIKKASILTHVNTWREVVDQLNPILPLTHRYLLRVEDYYTKVMFTVDTAAYSCYNPLFSTVKDTMSNPFEYVMLIADETTTVQDIYRSARLAKEGFRIYYKKDVSIDQVVKQWALEPLIEDLVN